MFYLYKLASGTFIFLVFLFVLDNANEGFSQTREEIVNGSAKIIKIDPSSRSPGSEKIDSILIQWQSSPTPQFFAEQNNLRTSEDKVSVYIYLDSYESVSKIPNDIDVLLTSDNIAVAFLSSNQINQLAQLDFVEQISLPIKARIPPIPILDQETNIDDSNLIGMSIGITIVIAIAVGGAVVYSKKKIKR